MRYGCLCAMSLLVCLVIGLLSVFGFLPVLAVMSAVVFGSFVTSASLCVYGLRLLSPIFSLVAERLSTMKQPSCQLNSTAPFDEAGELDRLFKNMADGQVPNFLELMAALSEIAYEMTSDCGPCLDCQRG